jgi:hypothetical protein
VGFSGRKNDQPPRSGFHASTQTKVVANSAGESVVGCIICTKAVILGRSVHILTSAASMAVGESIRAYKHGDPNHQRPPRFKSVDQAKQSS